MFTAVVVIAILGVFVANAQVITPSATSSSSTSTTSSSTVSASTANTPTTTVNTTLSSTTPSVTVTVTPITASVKPSTPKTTKKPAPRPLKSLKYLPGVCRNLSPKESAKCTTVCKKQGLKFGACEKLVPPPRIVALRAFLCFCF